MLFTCSKPTREAPVPFLLSQRPLKFLVVDLGIAAQLRIPKSELNLKNMNWLKTDVVSVKGVVFPFKKFPEADSILGPEMKSTGESMGRGCDYSEALMKAFVSSQIQLPPSGEVFLSLA
jgi:carbamoyl-phosphate synthase large subunit